MAIGGTGYGAGHFNGTVVKYANDTLILWLIMSAVLDGAESHKLESPSRVTGLSQSPDNRIIAADNPNVLDTPPRQTYICAGTFTRGRRGAHDHYDYREGARGFFRGS